MMQLSGVKRVPEGLAAWLQSFERWLLERLQQQPELLEHIQLTVRYRVAFRLPWLVEFKRELEDQLTLEWKASTQPLPFELLDELLARDNDYFWEQYVKDWLLARPLVPYSAPAVLRAIQGKSDPL